MKTDYIDPASSSAFINSTQKHENKDELLQGARLWESVRHEAVPNHFISIAELDDESKEMASNRVQSIADNLVQYIREYASVSSNETAAAEYSAFERAFKAHVIAEVGGRMLMAITRSLEMNALGSAKYVPELFEVEMVLDDEGKYTPRWSNKQTLQEKRLGRAAWVIAYARAHDFQGLAPEEVTELNRLEAMDEQDQLSDANMRTLNYLFERLQPGWGLLSTDEGREEVLSKMRSDCRIVAGQTLVDERGGLTHLEQAFLNELPNRPDEDLLPAIVSEIYRIKERQVQRGLRTESRSILGWIWENGAPGLNDKEREVLEKIGHTPSDVDLTPVVMADIDAIHDKVADIMENRRT